MKKLIGIVCTFIGLIAAAPARAATLQLIHESTGNATQTARVATSTGSFGVLLGTTATLGTASISTMTGTTADQSTTTHSGAHTFSSATVNGYFNYLGLMSYKRPRLEWLSTTQVNVETNTATSNTTQILFRDGELRTVTENLGTTQNFRQFKTGQTAAWTSGTIQGGIDSGSIATQTWYALYAVKVTSGTPNQNFVVVGSTFLPIVSRQAELNARFGTYGWVYLGLIHYGDGGSTNNVIVRFTQTGNFTKVKDSSTGASVVGQAILSTTTASATSIGVIYSAGVGAQQIPDNIGAGVWNVAMNTTAGTTFSASDQGFSNNLIYVRMQPNAVTKTVQTFVADASFGVLLTASTGVAMDIALTGWWDNALGVGPNPPF